MSKVILDLPEFTANFLKINCIEFVNSSIDEDRRTITISKNDIFISKEKYNIGFRTISLRYNHRAQYSEKSERRISYADFMSFMDDDDRREYIRQALDFDTSLSGIGGTGNFLWNQIANKKFLPHIYLDNGMTIIGKEEIALSELIKLLEDNRDAEPEDEDYE